MATPAQGMVQQIEAKGATMSRADYIDYLEDIIEQLGVNLASSKEEHHGYIQNDPHMPAGPQDGSVVQTSKGPPPDEDDDYEDAGAKPTSTNRPKVAAKRAKKRT